MVDIVDIYMDCLDFKETVRRSGLPVLVAHKRLLASGCLKIQDKIAFGSKAAKLGGKAEELFQKYVPDAVDANKFFKKNNPIYDFMFGDVTIDVKYSSVRVDKRTGTTHWGTKGSGEQDILCIFLEREKGTQLENPIILLVPMVFVDIKGTMHISKNSHWIKEFSVEPEEIQPTLKVYAESREQGLF